MGMHVLFYSIAAKYNGSALYFVRLIYVWMFLSLLICVHQRIIYLSNIKPCFIRFTDKENIVPASARKRKTKETPDEPNRSVRAKDKSDLPLTEIQEQIIPDIVEPIPDVVPDLTQMNEEQREQRVSQLLEEMGLAEPTADAGLKPQEKRTRREVSDGSETPLGSLDRTRVELDESVKTTDSQAFIK